MDIDNTRTQINNAIRRLQIPDQFREDAQQEGFLAILEGINPVTHLSKWYRKEKSFRDRIGISNEPYIEDPALTQKRLDARIDDRLI